MIELHGVYKAFESTEVLKGLDLTIEQGQTTTIIGGSGSGKSVLFKLIIGLLRPDAGEIRVEGVNIPCLSEWECTEWCTNSA